MVNERDVNEMFKFHEDMGTLYQKLDAPKPKKKQTFYMGKGVF